MAEETVADPLVTCGSCRHEFRALAALAGRSVPCPHCNAKVKVAVAAAEAPVDPLIGQVVADCKLTRRLGSGGIGLVYAAVQVGTNRAVAVKLLGAKAGADSVLVERFRREAQLQAALDHPHVVRAFTAGFERGAHYLVMEMVEGGTLSSLVDQYGRLPWAEACTLVAQVSRAIEALHGQGVIHRDLKPANILIGRDREGRTLAKLADLGLAKDVDGEMEPGMSLTLEGKPLGTPAYMAPEQIRDAKNAGRPADVYGLGATLYSAITGQRPYEGTSPMMVMAGVLKGPPADPRTHVSDLPAGVVAVIQAAMDREPRRRPPAEDLAAQLESLVGDAGTGAWRRPATRTYTNPSTASYARSGSTGRNGSSTYPTGVPPRPKAGSDSFPRPAMGSQPGRSETGAYTRPGPGVQTKPMAPAGVQPSTAPMIRSITGTYTKKAPVVDETGSQVRPDSAIWRDEQPGIPLWAIITLIGLGVLMVSLMVVLIIRP